MDGPRTVALLGLGLMGGSLARALRALAAPPRVVAWTPDGAHPDAALRAGVIDAAAADPIEAVRGADLVVLAAPVGACVALIRRIAPAIEDGARLTDVCSVKLPIARAAQGAGIGDRYVGSHPMCGSHEAGFGASRADLYQRTRVYIVPSADEIGTRRVETFWQGLGATTRRIEAGAHDALMARVSHVPQLVASALAAALGGARIPRDALGPGGAGMTRLAASSTPLWSDILLHNRSYVADALRELRAELDIAADALAAGDAAPLTALLARGRMWLEGTAR